VPGGGDRVRKKVLEKDEKLKTKGGSAGLNKLKRKKNSRKIDQPTKPAKKDHIGWLKKRRTP